MKDLDWFFDYMTPDIPLKPPSEVVVEHDGVLWDPITGLERGKCFVHGYRPHTRPICARYSRRSRFFSRLLDNFGVDRDKDVLKVMSTFDHVLAQWKLKREHYPRVYFLNVRCLLFLICKHLHLPPPFEQSMCLRDMKRFHIQEEMFNTFVCL